MDEIVTYSRELIDKGSKSFSGAARLFDARTRDDAYMLYAWCRYCDDLIDGQELGFRDPTKRAIATRETLNALRADTARALDGDADEPVFQALARVVSRNDIPDRHPMELIDGFEMDVDEVPFVTIEDTLSYCYHVAGVVGVMMAMVMGVRDVPTLRRASDLGIAFQLTNIARDVQEDAAAGRIYLPHEWLRARGLPPTPAAVLDEANHAHVLAVAQDLLNLAEDYYRSAGYGITHLPFRSAWAIAAAKNVYRDIGRRLKAEGEDAWARRTVVGKSRKFYGITLASVEALWAQLPWKRMPPPRADLWTPPGLSSTDETIATFRPAPA